MTSPAEQFSLRARSLTAIRTSSSRLTVVRTHLMLPHHGPPVSEICHRPAHRPSGCGFGRGGCSGVAATRVRTLVPARSSRPVAAEGPDPGIHSGSRFSWSVFARSAISVQGRLDHHSWCFRNLPREQCRESGGDQGGAAGATASGRPGIWPCPPSRQQESLVDGSRQAQHHADGHHRTRDHGDDLEQHKKRRVVAASRNQVEDKASHTKGDAQ